MMIVLSSFHPGLSVYGQTKDKAAKKTFLRNRNIEKITKFHSKFACEVMFNKFATFKFFSCTLFATLAKEEEDGPDTQHSFERQESGDTNSIPSTNLF